MALIDTSFHHIERQHAGYTSKAEAGVVSSIATDNSEDKSSYLKNDLVTLSNKKDEGSQNQHFSRNRYQAMAAYKAFSQPTFTGSSQLSDPFEKKTVEFYNDEKSDDAEDENSIVKDPIKETVEENKSDKSKDTDKSDNPEKKTDKDNDRKSNGEKLTDAEQKKVNQMKDRDAEVRTHEQAHARVGGQYAGAPVYEKEKGPDGKDYITDGHVNIDMSEESTPSKTVQKMQQVIRAAKAPAEPSGQDMKVAAEAQQKLNEASRKVLEENDPASKDDRKDINSDKENKNSVNSFSNVSDENKKSDETGKNETSAKEISTHKMDVASA